MPRGVTPYDEAQIQGRRLGFRDIPGIVTLWDAQQISTLSSGGVTQWVDAVGGLSALGSSTLPTISLVGRNGKPAVSTNGGSSYFSFNPATLPMGDFTIGVAAYMNTGINATDWRRVFGYGSGDNNTSVQILRRGSTTKVGEYTVGDGAVDWAGTDRFVVVTKAGTLGSLYIDGVLVKTGTFASTLSGTTGYIGRGIQYSDPWPGLIQTIPIYNRAFSANEVLKLSWIESYYNGKGGTNLPNYNTLRNRPPLIGD